ncbi:MAG: Unknown protein [uncultured Sulfurovum sp.]|uniref:Competence protein n=1 Tax=uncultured Sulfurovum sp. TaxID=269237 RepID=A0A6S6U639_9BACT|nr:MAG: Unknown protein [uncultured Sulfurovum sp.]
METSHYAIDNNGTIIEATRGLGKISKELGLTYFCGGCKKVVYPCTEGKIQVPHFRHEKAHFNKKLCGTNESYIHWISKELFSNFYKETLKFELILDSNVWSQNGINDNSIEIDKEIINLKNYYPNITVEQRNGEFIPDCMIYNYKEEKIYIEIKHKSGVSQKKIESGIPIIEINTFSEKVMERIIREQKLDTRGNMYTPVTIYNFDKFIYSNRLESKNLFTMNLT